MKQLMFIALALLLAACEKPVLDNEDAVTKKDANVILHFKQYEWTEQREPFELARRWPSRDGQRRSQQESFTRSAGNAKRTYLLFSVMLQK